MHRLKLLHNTVNIVKVTELRRMIFMLLNDTKGLQILSLCSASVSIYKKKIELKIKIQNLLFAFRYRVLNM